MSEWVTKAFVKQNPDLEIMNIFWPDLNILTLVSKDKMPCQVVYGTDPITQGYPLAHITKHDSQNLNIFSKCNIK